MQFFSFAFAMAMALMTWIPVALSQDSSTPAPHTGISFDNIAEKLPDAFHALESQFSDPQFRSQLTSQLENPNAVQMFQSLIHDQSAVNSISSLLENPNIQSSLSVQFFEQYLDPTGTLLKSAISQMATNAHHTDEASNDVSSPTSIIESTMDDSGATAGKPRMFTIGFLLTIFLGVIGPIWTSIFFKLMTFYLYFYV